jgi:hypothetical protein
MCMQHSLLLCSRVLPHANRRQELATQVEHQREELAVQKALLLKFHAASAPIAKRFKSLLELALEVQAREHRILPPATRQSASV